MRNRINITISTGLSELGGVASSVSILNTGFFQKWNMKHIATHTNISHLLGINKVLLFAFAVIKLTWYLLFFEVGVVHVHMASRGSYSRKSLIIRLAKKFKAKVVLHLHGGEFAHFYADECGLHKQAHIRHTFDLADAVVVLSSQWLNWVTSIMTDPSKAHVVYNAVETVKTDRSNTEIGQILYLGRMNEKKGVKDLIDAFSVVASCIPHARLALGGDGDVEQFKRQAEHHGIADKVEFLGWVSGTKKISWMSKSDIYCLPSYNEGFPMGILEAMSANVPVIASTVGGIPDAIESDVQGLLIEAGDVQTLAEHMILLIKDRNKNKQLSSNAREKFLANFSKEAVFPKLDQIYVDLIGN